MSTLAETTHRLSVLIEQLEQLMRGAEAEIRCLSQIGSNRLVLQYYFFILHSGGWNHGPLDTAAT
jgi:hypothetical protein